VTSRLIAVTFPAHAPADLARFWSAVLGWESTADPVEGTTLLPADHTGFRIRFIPSDEPKAGPNHTHFDLTSSSPAEQQATVERVLEHGGRHIDIGQLPEEGHVVLADPEGNELCVIEPGNTFLADCGFVGAVNADGSRACGYFWSKVLDWPLVWDQDEETAIRSPHGGPMLTWSGPPLEPKSGSTYRPHLDIAPVDGDQQAEVARLESLGATRVDIGQGDVSWVVMADPDGHEFCVFEPSAGA
jgi:predicted enzyme related to lactoylglutathione lyase